MNYSPSTGKKSIFVGRIDEQNQYRHILQSILRESSLTWKLKYWLGGEKEDAQAHIVLIQGEGGIGKSALIKRFREITESEEYFANKVDVLFLDWEIEKFHSVELQTSESSDKTRVVLQRIYNAVVEKGWERYFKEYKSLSDLLNTTEKKVANAVINEGTNNKIRDLGAEAIARIIRRGTEISEHRNGPLASGTLESPLLGSEKLSEIRFWLKETAELDDHEYQIYCQPYETLARALGRGFASVSHKRPLTIYLDTYDIIFFSDPWIRTIIKLSGSCTVWIIAANNNLSKTKQFINFVGYNAEFPHKLLVLEIPELAIDHVVEYIKARAPSKDFERKDAELLHHLSFGIPLALEQATDFWINDIAFFSKINQQEILEPQIQIAKLMSQRLLEGVVDRYEKHVLYILAMQRRPDPSVQASILLREDNPSVELTTILERLESKYSIIKTIGGARIHESISKFMRDYLLSSELRTSEEVRMIVSLSIDACQRKKEQLEQSLVEIEERCDSEDWKDIVLDKVHWLFWKDEYDVWNEFIPRFIEGLAYSKDLVDGLLAVAETFRDILGKDGRRRLQTLKDGVAGEIEAVQAMVVELEKYLDQFQDESNEHQAIMLVKRARINVISRQYNAAIHLYEQAEKKLTNRNEKLRIQIADAYAELGWRTSSTILFRRSLDLSYADAQYLFLLGRKRLRSCNYAQAIAAYEKLIELLPNDFFFYAALGFTYRHTGNFNDAAHMFSKAIDINPEDEFSCLGLGNSYLALGKIEEAQQVFIRLISMNSRSPSAHSSLMSIYRRTGNMSKSDYHKGQARKLFESQHSFSLSRSHYDRACFEALCGNTDVALSELSKAIENSEDLRDLAKFDLDFDEIRSSEGFQQLTNESMDVIDGDVNV